MRLDSALNRPATTAILQVSITFQDGVFSKADEVAGNSQRTQCLEFNVSGVLIGALALKELYIIVSAN